MGRPLTLFTGQWADLPLEDLARKAADFGYDGLELACWGDHFDVHRALTEDGYCAGAARPVGALRSASPRHQRPPGRPGGARSRSMAGTRRFCRAHVWGDGDPAGVNSRAAEELKNTARAAQKLGVDVVNGFTGSSIWHLLYAYPPLSPADDRRGLRAVGRAIQSDPGRVRRVRRPVRPGSSSDRDRLRSLYRRAGARRRSIGAKSSASISTPAICSGKESIRSSFCAHFPTGSITSTSRTSIVTLNGRSGILGSHLPFGDPRRGWEFRSPGRGGVDFEQIIRTLNHIRYEGPLSVEWEDVGMDREAGAKEACQFVRNLDFAPSTAQFDAAFAEN